MSVILMFAELGLDVEARRASRTRVDEGGRYVGIPRNDSCSPAPMNIGSHSIPQLLRCPILDEGEQQDPARAGATLPVVYAATIAAVPDRCRGEQGPRRDPEGLTTWVGPHCPA